MSTSGTTTSTRPDPPSRAWAGRNVRDRVLRKKAGTLIRRWTLASTVVSALALGSRAVPAEEIKVETLVPRPGVSLQVLLLRADNPVASVALFAGADGRLGGFQSNGIPVRGDSFPVRSRAVFLSQGMTVAVVDAPSDRQGDWGLLGFRQSPEHMQDVSAVMRHLRERANVPVWLVGTSMGTVSVAAAAIWIKDGGPDGIVLTSSIVDPSLPGGLPSRRLWKIRVPALVVHHEMDECRHTLFEDVPPVLAAMTGSPRKELVSFRDGGPPRGDPCGPWGYHGYPGIESKTVIRITDWIKATR